MSEAGQHDRRLRQAVVTGVANQTLLACPLGTYVQTIRGLTDLQLRALRVECSPHSIGGNASSVLNWGDWSLLHPQALGTDLWQPVDPRNLVPPLVFNFACDGGFDGVRTAPGACRTLAERRDLPD